MNLLRTYNVSIGLIASSVIFPLMVGYAKQQWDMANWEQQKRADEIRARLALSLKNRAEVLDELHRVYGAYLIAARFLVADVQLKRLDSEIGREHRKSYDSEMRMFFRDSFVLLFKTRHYFIQGAAYTDRLRALLNWCGDLDLSITSAVEKTDNASSAPRAMSGGYFIPTGLVLVPDLKDEGHDRDTGSNDRTTNVWRGIEGSLNQLERATTETLNAMAGELSPDFKELQADSQIVWKNVVDPEMLERARHGIVSKR